MIGRPTSSGVDDVAVALALVEETLSTGARSAKRLVEEFEFGQAKIWNCGVAQADRPTEGVRFIVLLG